MILDIPHFTKKQKLKNIEKIPLRESLATK
jgi:hypothetical protein